MPSADVNWKLKYQELKMKYMSSVDTAFRLGFEQGAQQAQVQSAQDQAQQQAEQAGAQQAQRPGGEQGGAEQAQDQPQEQAQPESAHPGGSELDQHIQELSSMLGKSEIIGDDLQTLKKSFGSLKASLDLAKSQQAISSIAKSLKLAENISAPIKHAGVSNMNPTAKKALNMQETIVSEIMNAWSQESNDAKNEIMNIIKKD